MKSKTLGEDDIQHIDILAPGKTIWVSPKAQNLVSVTLTTKEVLVATRDFRESITMVSRARLMISSQVLSILLGSKD